MTNYKTEQAKKVDDAYWKGRTNIPDIYTKGRVRFAAGLREVINQLQQGTTVGAVIMCTDVLELCDELEKL
jgi:hypothetical protein